MRPGALGDTLMALPALAEAAGRASITFAGRGMGLFFLRPWTAAVCDLENPGWHRLFGPQIEHFELPIIPPDIVAAFFMNPQPNLLQNLHGWAPEASLHYFPSLPPDGPGHHVARHMAEGLAKAGLAVDPARALQRCGRQALVKTGYGPRPRETLLFHPGSGGREKNYDPAFWIECLRRLRVLPRFAALKPVCLLGPAEMERRSAFVQGAGFDLETALCPPPDSLAELLESTALYLGHDSGVTHLSAMAGTPTLAFFRRRNFALWHPLGPRVRVLYSPEADEFLLRKAAAAAEKLAAPPHH